MKLNNRLLEILAYLFFILIVLNRFKISSAIDHVITSFFTVVLIISKISNPKKLLSFENPVLNFLGKISFGLYVWNPLVIYICSLLKPYQPLKLGVYATSIFVFYILHFFYHLNIFSIIPIF